MPGSQARLGLDIDALCRAIPPAIPTFSIIFGDARGGRETFSDLSPPIRGMAQSPQQTTIEQRILEYDFHTFLQRKALPVPPGLLPRCLTSSLFHQDIYSQVIYPDDSIRMRTYL